MAKVRLTAREQRIEDWFETPMIVVTFLLLFTLAVPYLFPLAQYWVYVFNFFNLLIWSTFYIELFTKVYVAESKLESLKRNWYLVLITIIPLFLPFRLIRISRLFGLISFLRLQKFAERMRENIRNLIYNIEYILVSLIAFIFSSAFVMWQIESRHDGSIESLSDALWWSVITIASVGYKDVVPGSEMGKIFGAIVSLLGTVIFMVFVARVTAMFVHDKDMETIKKLIEKEGN